MSEAGYRSSTLGRPCRIFEILLTMLHNPQYQIYVSCEVAKLFILAFHSEMVWLVVWGLVASGDPSVFPNAYSSQ
jgi:hypothetical protein